MPNKPKILYHSNFCGEEIGEADGFFALSHNPPKLRLVACWSLNDAYWRGEYMDGLIKYFGGLIKPLPEKYHSRAEKLIAESWGL